MADPPPPNPAIPVLVPTELLVEIDNFCESFEKWLNEHQPRNSSQLISQLQDRSTTFLAGVQQSTLQAVWFRLSQEILPIAWKWEDQQQFSIDISQYRELQSDIPGSEQFIQRLFHLWKQPDQIDATKALWPFLDANTLPVTPDLSTEQLQELLGWIKHYRENLHQQPTQSRPSQWFLQQAGIPAVLRDACQNMERLEQWRNTDGEEWTIGDFKIVREIGRGGMGVVFEATQISLGRTVALKVLWSGAQASTEAVKRFQREALTVAKLHHTNIVPIFYVGSEGSFNFYAMQFIEGKSLDKWNDGPGRPIDWDSVASWGLQAAEALSHAHQRGIIHRDVKPSNLLIDQDQRIWLTDFGLAKQQNDVTLSVAGALLGTPRYMSPEQASAAAQAVDQRSDIYSLGATLYELATGHPVFDADTPHGVISQILNCQPIPANRHQTQIPRDFNTILMKCLAKDPSNRYATATELAADLRALLEGRSIRAKQPNILERSQLWLRQHRNEVGWSAASITASVVFCAIFIAAWIGYRSLREVRLSLASPTVPLIAQMFDTAGRRVGRAQTVPTQDPLPIQPGDYRLSASSKGILSQDYDISLSAGDHIKQTLNPTDQLIAPVISNVLGAQLIANAATNWVVSYDAQKIMMEQIGTTHHDRFAIPWETLAAPGTAASFSWDAACLSNQNTIYGSKTSLQPVIELVDGKQLGLPSDYFVLATKHQAFIALIDCRGDVVWSQGLAADVTETETIAEQITAVRQFPRSTIVEGPFLVADLNQDSHKDIVVHVASVPPTGMPQLSSARRYVMALSGHSGDVLWSTEIPQNYFSLPDQAVPYHYRWFTGLNTGSSEGGSGAFFNQGYWTRNSQYSCELTGQFVAVGTLIHSGLNSSDSSEDEQNPSRQLLYQVGSKLLFIEPYTGKLGNQVADLGGIPLLPPMLWKNHNLSETNLYWVDHGKQATATALGGGPPVPPQNDARLRVMAWSVSEQKLNWEKTVDAHLPPQRTWLMKLPSWPMVVDLDDDDRPELILPDRTSRNAVGIQKETALLALDAINGQTKWMTEIRHVDSQLERWVVGPDRDSDGTRDIYLLSMSGMPVRVHLDVVSGTTGKVLIKGYAALQNQEHPDAFFLCNPILWKHSPDGWPQLAVPLQSTHNRAGEGTELMIFSTKTAQMRHHATHVHKVETGDADGDSIPDLILTQLLTPELGLAGQVETRFVRGSAGNRWDRLGKPLHRVSDLNQDGTDDLVEVNYRHIIARDALTGLELWRHALSGRAAQTIVHSCAHATPTEPIRNRQKTPPSTNLEDPRHWDFDRDGVPDLLLEPRSGGSKTELLHAISGRTGESIWNSEPQKAYQQGHGRLTCQDMDQDGIPEILYVAFTDSHLVQRSNRTTWSGNDGTLTLFVISAATGNKLWHVDLSREYGSMAGQNLPYEFESSTLPEFLIGDLNADGVQDILVAAEPDANSISPLTCTWVALDGAKHVEIWRRNGVPCNSLGQSFSQPTLPRIDQEPPFSQQPVSQVYFLEVRDHQENDVPYNCALHIVAVTANAGRELWEEILAVDPSFRNRSSHHNNRLAAVVINNDEGRQQLLVAYEHQQRDLIALLDNQGNVIARREFHQSNEYPKPPILWATFDTNDDAIVDSAIVGSELEIVNINDGLTTRGTIAARFPQLQQLTIEVVTLEKQKPDMLVLHDRGESPRVTAFDGNSGALLWTNHGPARHRAYSADFVPTIYLPGKEPSSSVIVYNHLDQTNARTIASAELNGKTLTNHDLFAASLLDVRFQRILPWAEQPLLSQSFIDTGLFYLTAAFHALLLVILPLTYVWFVFRTGKLTLRWLLVLPCITALVIVVARRAASDEPGGLVALYAISFMFAPFVAMLAMLGWQIAKRAWKPTATIVGTMLTATATLAGLLLAAQQFNSPLASGEFYSLDGWYWILPQGFVFAGVVYWSARCLLFAIDFLRTSPLQSLSSLHISDKGRGTECFQKHEGQTKNRA